MGDSNASIPSSSQESETSNDPKTFGSDDSVVGSSPDISVSKTDFINTENEKSSTSALPLSKVTKPPVVRLPHATTNTAPRVGRLCNNILKPAIPPKSCQNSTGIGGGTTMSTMSSIRKITDELAKKRISDIDDADENTVPLYSSGKWSYDRKMSSGSILSDLSRKSYSGELRKKKSSDASLSADSFSDYWKSDFEPRRASDASVVLTEDTDQFIIGDRVWVGGVKPGHIAYIGETQFAPGEWAGVVLDEPIGKNDGTVANIRYFQCEPKKGIFSRLTRLTRYPLIEGSVEAIPCRPSSAESKKSIGSLLTLIPTKSSLTFTVTPAPKNIVSKPSSPDSALNPGVAVGDRVIVKSSQGSKAGILRYLGTTDFAPGEWCGVELDEPLGKNDGSVSGTRYFECRPKFGLFAPLHKVSKSPANKHLSTPCIIQRGGSTVKIKRPGSKESLLSLSSTTSATVSLRSARKTGVRTPATPTSTKNSLQETLKEKEQHIEQLLKERDLERAEVTRAASQADEAERQLICLKKEFEQQKEEAAARISDLDSLVKLLKNQNEQLSCQLEDEKKKYEDLQFRFEEEIIDKTDLKNLNLQFQEKLIILEKNLTEERKKSESLEQDSNKLFEAEEHMVCVKVELDQVKQELAENKEICHELEQGRISLEAHLTTARAEIDSLKIENKNLKACASEEATNCKENVEKSVHVYEECKKALERKADEMDKLTKEMCKKEKSFVEKEKEVHEKYVTIINELTAKHKSETANLLKQTEDIKNRSEIKIKFLETKLDEKMKASNLLETKLNEVNIQLSKIVAEKSVELSKQKETEQKLQKEVKCCAEELRKREEALKEEVERSGKFQRDGEKIQKDMAEMKMALCSSLESSKKQNAALNAIVNEQKEGIENLKAECEKKSNECVALNELMEKTKKELERKVEELTKEKQAEVDKIKIELESTEQELETRKKELKELRESQEESFKSKMKCLEDAETERKKEIEILKRVVEKTKNSLEAKENEVRNEQQNSKKLSEKLMALEENYKRVMAEKYHHQVHTEDVNRTLQTVEEKLEEEDLSNFISCWNDASKQVLMLREELKIKATELDSLRGKMFSKMDNIKLVEEENLEKHLLEMPCANYKKSIEELNKEILALKNKLDLFSCAIKETEDGFAKTVSETLIATLEEKIRNLEKKEADDKNLNEAKIKDLRVIKDQLECKLKETELELKETKCALEKKVEKLITEKNCLLDTVEKMKMEFFSNEKKLHEKFKINAELHANESEKLKNELRETTKKLATTAEELAKAKDEKNKLNEDKSKLEGVTIAMEELLKQTQARSTELEVNVSSVESENKVLKETIKQLREEKCLIDKDATEKMMLVAELKSQLEALECSKNTLNGEIEAKYNHLLKENEKLKEKLTESEQTRLDENEETKQKIENLTNEIDRLTSESNRICCAKEKEIENINIIVETLKKELFDFKTGLNRKCEEIKNMKKILEERQLELEQEKMKCEEFAENCKEAEAELVELRTKYNEQSTLLMNSSELMDKLAEAGKKLMEVEKREREAVNNSKLEKEALEKALETTNCLLGQKEKEARDLCCEIESLKKERNILLKSLENEKMELQKKFEEIKKIPGKVIKNDIIIVEEAQRELQEEREYAKGQVDFLNSVIVDMQKKNDALKARIEILEMGFSAEDADECALHNIKSRTVAPRLFCDICDRFDLHDTEDCPTQAAVDHKPLKCSNKPRGLSSEKPFCENCEVFGHNTADCDDSETF